VLQGAELQLVVPVPRLGVAWLGGDGVAADGQIVAFDG
jgi:hypothetical protein